MPNTTLPKYNNLPHETQRFVEVADQIAKSNGIVWERVYHEGGCSWMKAIRRGRSARLPSVDEVHQFGNALRCSFNQRLLLLDAAHHPRVIKQELAGDDREKVLEKAQFIVNYLPLAAFVVNRRWQIECFNHYVPPLFGTSLDKISRTPLEQRQVLRYLVDPNLEVYKLFMREPKLWEYTLRLNMYWFYRDNAYYRNDPWYRPLINELLSFDAHILKDPQWRSSQHANTLSRGPIARLWEEVENAKTPEQNGYELPFPSYVTGIPLLPPAVVLRLRGLHASLTEYEFPKLIIYLPDDADSVPLFARLGLPVPGAIWKRGH